MRSRSHRYKTNIRAIRRPGSRRSASRTSSRRQTPGTSCVRRSFSRKWRRKTLTFFHSFRRARTRSRASTMRSFPSTATTSVTKRSPSSSRASSTVSRVLRTSCSTSSTRSARASRSPKSCGDSRKAGQRSTTSDADIKSGFSGTTRTTSRSGRRTPRRESSSRRISLSSTATRRAPGIRPGRAC